MEWVTEQVGTHRRFSPRIWLITIPSAIISFERRSEIPKLPVAGTREAGALLLLAAAALGFWSARHPEASISYRGPLSPAVHRPARLAGLIGIAGAACILRSTTLLVYSLGLAVAGGLGRIELEEPTASNLVGNDGP
jgi:hypothetical protein